MTPRYWLLPLILTLLAAPATAEEMEFDDLESLLSIEIETAAKYDQTVRDAPASVTVITAEEIRRFGYRTLGDVLRNVRSFYAGSDRNYGYLGVRGFSRPTDYNARVLVMINDHPLNDNFYGSVGIDYETAVTMRSVERIEIVRGPGSALYGSGAMFGVINVITRDPEVQDGALLGVEAGDLGQLHGDLVWGRKLGDVGLLFAGSVGKSDGEDLYFEEFDDPETNDGVYENNDQEEYTLALVRTEWKGLELQGYWDERDKGIPTSSYESDFNSQLAFTRDRYSHLDARYELEIGERGSLLFKGAWDHYDSDGSYPYEEVPWVEENRGTWWTLGTQLTWDFDSSNRTVVGLDYVDSTEAYYFAFDGYDVLFDEDIPFEQLSLYGQHAWQIQPELALTLGLRWDDFSDVDGELTPRIALVWHPTEKGTLKAIWGRSFRRPNHYERYYEDFDYQIANPDLKPETINTAELIWEQPLGSALYLTLGAFSYEMDDLITGIETEDELVQFVNLEQADALGFEAQLDLRMPSGIWGYFSWTYQDAEDATTSERLSNSPEHLLRLGLNAPAGEWLFVGAQARWEDERLTVYDTLSDSFFELDLHLTSAPFWERVELSLHLLNALDEGYDLPGGFEHVQATLPQPGRRFRFGSTLRF